MNRNELTGIMPKINPAKVDLYLQFITKAMEESEITTPLRQAAFLAQIAHESDELKYMSEVWGPTPAQIRYDPPSSLSKRLGNIQIGDGFKYRGAGPLQLTGRANYRTCGRDLGLDLEGNPDMARTPEVGFRIAAWYWKSHKLNQLADKPDFDAITKAVNGGFNGKASRDAYYIRAKVYLGVK